LTLYYLVVMVVIAGFIVLTGDMKGMEARQATSDLGESVLAPLFRSLPPLASGAAAVIGAFLLALPVAFVYVRTRNSLKYDQSLVQTVIMLPVVITSILIVVQNSLALAFSLAGIVAAVRFRNNLKDSRDAVYIFAAVGVGFASGVGQLAIAAFLSLFFCVLELLLWKLDLTADHERTFGMLCMPAPPPGQVIPRGMIPVGFSGDASSGAPSADTTLLAMGGAEPAPNGKPKKLAESVRFYVTDPDTVRPLIEEVLLASTKEFKHRKTRSSGNNQYVLEYQLRTRKKSPADVIFEQVYEIGAPYVIAAETVERSS
jgi:hypothetical protein